MVIHITIGCQHFELDNVKDAQQAIAIFSTAKPLKYVSNNAVNKHLGLQLAIDDDGVNFELEIKTKKALTTDELQQLIDELEAPTIDKDAA